MGTVSKQIKKNKSENPVSIIEDLLVGKSTEEQQKVLDTLHLSAETASLLLAGKHNNKLNVVANALTVSYQNYKEGYYPKVHKIESEVNNARGIKPKKIHELTPLVYSTDNSEENLKWFLENGDYHPAIDTAMKLYTPIMKLYDHCIKSEYLQEPYKISDDKTGDYIMVIDETTIRLCLMAYYAGINSSFLLGLTPSTEWFSDITGDMFKRENVRNRCIRLYLEKASDPKCDNLLGTHTLLLCYALTYPYADNIIEHFAKEFEVNPKFIMGRYIGMRDKQTPMNPNEIVDWLKQGYNYEMQPFSIVENGKVAYRLNDKSFKTSEDLKKEGDPDGQEK